MDINKAKQIANKFIAEMNKSASAGNTTVNINQDILAAFSTLTRCGVFTETSLMNKTEYPNNLLKDLGINNVKTLSSDQILGINHILNYVLTDKEYSIIQDRYNNGLTLKEIANKLSLSRERIRQISVEAIRKIKKYIKDIDILSGYSNIISTESAKKEYEIRQRMLERDIERTHKYQQAINRINTKYKNRIEDIDISEEDRKTLNKFINQEDLLNKSILELDISHRLYYHLRNAGYNQIKDFIGVTYADLLGINHLGRKSIDELVLKLVDYNINIK